MMANPVSSGAILSRMARWACRLFFVQLDGRRRSPAPRPLCIRNGSTRTTSCCAAPRECSGHDDGFVGAGVAVTGKNADPVPRRQWRKPEDRRDDRTTRRTAPLCRLCAGNRRAPPKSTRRNWRVRGPLAPRAAPQPSLMTVRRTATHSAKSPRSLNRVVMENQLHPKKKNPPISRRDRPS